jgi:hypothetical protein
MSATGAEKTQIDAEQRVKDENIRMECAIKDAKKAAAKQVASKLAS